jgi:1,2-diacylglycerol 3-alpha-glucosyltransferase
VKDHANVAMVAAMPYPTGQGTQSLLSELCRGLASRGHQVHLVCYHHAAFRREEPFLVHRIPGVPLYRRLRSGPDFFKPFLDALILQRTIQVVRRFGCQLIHAHNYEGAMAGALAAGMCRIPCIYHAHNLMEDELPRYFKNRAAARMARWTGAGLDRTVPRAAGLVIALHDKLAEALRHRGVSAERIRVVEPGIDVRFWDGNEHAEREPVVVYAGNLDAYQDLTVLFSAMPRVAARVPGARLLVATMNDPEEARRLAAVCGAAAITDVVITPHAEDTRRILHSARVAVSPRSSFSGFPVKNLNAQAAGLPVVACQGSAFGFDPGRTGLAVPNGDPAALADALVELLQDPARAHSYGQAGRRLMNERYTRERMIESIEGVWTAALS